MAIKDKPIDESSKEKVKADLKKPAEKKEDELVRVFKVYNFD